MKIKYPLESLLRKREWDVDIQKGQLAVQRALVDELKNSYLLSKDRYEGQISRIEAVFSGQSLSLSRYELERAYLPELSRKMEEAQIEWLEAIEVEEQMRERLRELMIELQVTQEHKKQHLLEAMSELQKKELKAADEQWLLTNPIGGFA